MEFISIDNELAPSKIEIRSKVELIFIKRLVSNTEFKVEIDKKGLVKIESSNGYSISRTKISEQND